MRVLLIYLDICKFGGRPSLGLGYVSSVLKDAGRDTSILHIKNELSKDKMLEEISRHKPDLVGFSSTTNQFPYVRLYARWIKEALDVPIVVGGAHATLAPEETIATEGVDSVCRGEGEYAMLDLANALYEGRDIRFIQNLWIREGEKIFRNDLRPLVEDLDTLPFPDRDGFDYSRLLKAEWGDEAEIMAGRGCPFDCAYCSNHAISELYRGKGTYVRMRSVENVLDEIEYIIKRYRPKRLIFHDDTFTLNRRWIEEFCTSYHARFDLSFACNARVGTVDRGLLSRLKEAGCDHVKIGVESGNEHLRSDVLNRRMSNQDIIQTFKDAHALGLRTSSFNMIGLPYETPSMIEETIQLNRQISPDGVQVTVFYPFPGTKLYELCDKNSWLGPRRLSSYYEEDTVLDQPTLTREQVRFYYRRFARLTFEIRNEHSWWFPIYRGMKLCLRNNVYAWELVGRLWRIRQEYGESLLPEAQTQS